MGYSSFDDTFTQKICEYKNSFHISLVWSTPENKASFTGNVNVTVFVSGTFDLL